MNAFYEASKIEQRSWEILRPLFEQRSFNGRYVVTKKGRLARELQISVGDVLFNSDEDCVWTVEIKAEQRKTGNFFVEHWSNRSRFTPGWAVMLNADLLMYHFLESDELFVMRFQRLKQWLFSCEHRGRPPASNYQHAMQGKYQQMNDTWGLLVPIADVAKAIGFDIIRPASDLRGTVHVRPGGEVKQTELQL